MQKYLLRRAAFGALTLFGVSVIIFVVMRILPGDPLVAMFGMVPTAVSTHTCGG